MVRMDSFSSVPPHIQPPLAQVPSAIRELTRFVPSMLMYSSIFPLPNFLVRSELFLLAQRTNVRHQSVNLILAERTLERGHSTLAARNCLSELRIRQLLDCRRAKIGNLHALSNFRTTSVRA